MADRISLATQAGHLNWLCNLADRLQPEAIRSKLLAPKEAALRAEYSAAVVGTMKWLVAHEATIKRMLAHRAEIEALLAMDPADRAVILSHGPMVAELAQEKAAEVAS